MATTMTTTSATLTCTQTLMQDTKTIGTGPSAIRYKPQSPAWDTTFTRNGEWLAACYGAPDPCIRMWKWTGTEYILHSVLTGIHDRTIRSVAFCPLGLVLAAASFDSSVSLWEFNKSDNEWECTTQLEGHENEVKCVAWNATGSLLATCGRDKTVWLWETFLDGSIGGSSDNDMECVAVLNGHEGDVKFVTFAPSHGQWGDGDEIVISAGYDDTIKIWAEDAGDWYCAASLSDIHNDTIWSLTTSPSGGRLISASADGSMSILKAYTITEKKELFPEEDGEYNGFWKCVGQLPDAHSSTIYSVDYAPARVGHGRIVSSGADDKIQIYREAMGSSSDKPLFSIELSMDTSHGDVNSVLWHPTDGSILVSASDDGNVRLWNYQPSSS